VTFTATFNDDGTYITGTAGCDTGYLHVDGTAQFQDPLDATDSYDGCVSWSPVEGLVGELRDTNDGSLDGCGRGTFVMDQTKFESLPDGHHLKLYWHVEDGTGAFLGATGGGTGLVDFSPPTSTNQLLRLPNHGTYTGTINCPHHA